MKRVEVGPSTYPVVARKTAFRNAVIRWYRAHARALPWRGTTDPYAVWVSEIALQQTRVEQGTPYILRFLNAFPTISALADASPDSVLKHWEGLGYYARARNIHRAAKQIQQEHDGVMPQTAEDLLTLPGIGRYTAGAIASIAFNEAAPILDGNVKRVLARITDLPKSIDEPSTTADLWDLAGTLVRGKSPGDFNQGMMELGAEVCKPSSPRCAACPVVKFCLAHDRGSQHKRPVRTPKKQTPHYDIAIAAIKKNGRYLIGKRPEKGLLGGMWEFPGGKIEKGESVENALRREIREELGIRVDVGDSIATVRHAYSHFRVTLHVFACQHRSGRPRANAHTELKWIQPSRFEEFAFPKANHKFLDKL